MVILAVVLTNSVQFLIGGGGGFVLMLWTH